MKIAILIKRFIQTGGAERIAVELSRSLVKRGHDVHVYCQEMDPNACTGVVFHPIRRRLHKPTHLNAWCFAIDTARLVKKERYDIVQSFERGLRADIFYVTCICYRNWMWREQSRAQRIFNYVKVAVDPRHMSYLLLESLQFRKGVCNRKIVATSRLIKEDIIANYGLAPTRSKWFILASRPTFSNRVFVMRTERKSVTRTRSETMRSSCYLSDPNSRERGCIS